MRNFLALFVVAMAACSLDADTCTFIGTDDCPPGPSTPCGDCVDGNCSGYASRATNNTYFYTRSANPGEAGLTNVTVDPYTVIPCAEATACVPYTIFASCRCGHTPFIVWDLLWGYNDLDTENSEACTGDGYGGGSGGGYGN